MSGCGEALYLFQVSSERQLGGAVHVAEDVHWPHAGSCSISQVFSDNDGIGLGPDASILLGADSQMFPLLRALAAPDRLSCLRS